MERGKVVLKGIKNKSNGRRNNLLKKSQELMVLLCDFDVAAAFVFSGTNKLFEFSTGERMANILTRYQSFKKAEEELNHESVLEKLPSEHSVVSTTDEMTEIIKRHLEENNIKLIDKIGLDKLEKQLDRFLQQVRIRKTQLSMGVLKALQDEEVKLKKEREFLMEEIKAMTNEMTDKSGDAEQQQLP